MQLARAVRNRTTGVLYVLDEPSIGLHPDNVEGLLTVMDDLVADGNSVVVVDHDVRVLRTADHIVEVGPRSGAEGGTVIAQGTPEEVADAMGGLIREGLVRGWGMSMVNVELMERAQAVTPLAAVQNIYSMMERDYETTVIPCCERHDVGFVAYSPIASGFLSGKIKTDTAFEKVDDVRNWVPQLTRENIAARRIHSSPGTRNTPKRSVARSSSSSACSFAATCLRNRL